VPALRDTLRVGQPALVSLNDTLPTLRTFAREALPGVRSTPATLNASMPFIRQARLLVRPQELRGLADDLSAAIPDLARVNRSAIPLLDQQRALSACTADVLVPFSREPIPDPDFADKYPDANNQPFYKEAGRGLAGLAAESRVTDAVGPMFHIQFSSGPANVVVQNEGQSVFAGTANPPEGVRPIRPERRPMFRPGTPCETQEPPDMNAAGGSPDQTVLANGQEVIGGIIPPLPKTAQGTPTAEQQLKLEWVLEAARLRAKGIHPPDPMQFSAKTYPKELEKAGLATTKKGKIYKKGDAKARAQAEAEETSTVR
jgi:hypothetical protein